MMTRPGGSAFFTFFSGFASAGAGAGAGAGAPAAMTGSASPSMGGAGRGRGAAETPTDLELIKWARFLRHCVRARVRVCWSALGCHLTSQSLLGSCAHHFLRSPTLNPRVLSLTGDATTHSHTPRDALSRAQLYCRPPATQPITPTHLETRCASAARRAAYQTPRRALDLHDHVRRGASSPPGCGLLDHHSKAI